MKKIIITILILSSLVLSGCGMNINEERVLEDDKWIEDINYLDENMKRRHPNLFNSISNQQWDESIDELKKDVGKLSDNGIRVVKCDDEYKEILGYKLLSINKIDIEEIITKLYTSC